MESTPSDSSTSEANDANIISVSNDANTTSAASDYSTSSLNISSHPSTSSPNDAGSAVTSDLSTISSNNPNTSSVSSDPSTSLSNNSSTSDPSTSSVSSDSSTSPSNTTSTSSISSDPITSLPNTDSTSSTSDPSTNNSSTRSASSDPSTNSANNSNTSSPNISSTGPASNPSTSSSNDSPSDPSTNSSNNSNTSTSDISSGSTSNPSTSSSNISSTSTANISSTGSTSIPSTSSVAGAVDRNLARFLFNRAMDSSKSWTQSLGTHISSGVSEMFKWTVVTAINDVIRRPISACIDYIVTYFTVSVEIASTDELYRNFTDWMAAQEFVKSTRELIAQSVRTKPPKINFVPGKGMHFFWYKRRPAWIWRPTFVAMSTTNEILRITTLGRDTNRIKQLLKEAMDFSRRSEVGKYLVYTPTFISSSIPEWKVMGEPRVPRAPETLILPEGQYEDIKNDCKRFLERKAWYAERGIPYRRGYLFYGAPGSGKSSLTEVLAGALGLNIAILSLSHPVMTDQYLSLLVNIAPSDAIVFIEDIDTMFENRQKQNESNKPKLNQLTFSGLLNALDGVSAQGGRILMMTTNHIELLDKALIRDGRVDRKIQFHDATQQQAHTLFARFFTLPESDPRCEQFSSAVPPGKFSMAKLQGHLLRHLTPEAALAHVHDLTE